MKSWSTIKKEMSLQEYFKIVLNYREHFVADTEHSVDRFKERTGLNIFIYEKLLKKAINWIYNNHKEAIEDRYIFRSKKYGFGIQLEWRKDRKSGHLQGFTATTLSDNEMKYYLKNDKEVFVEQLINLGNTLTESIQSVEKSYVVKEIPFYNYGYDVFIECGKVYYNFELVEI